MRLRVIREQLNRSEPPGYPQVIELVELLEARGGRARGEAAEVLPIHDIQGKADSAPAAGLSSHP